MGYSREGNVANLIKIATLVLTLSLMGCQQEKDDLAAFVATVKAQKKPDIEPIPVMKPYETFSYAATELRNPFIKTIVEQPEETLVPLVENGIHPEKHRRKEALESYSLSELQLVGTLERKGIWALIRSSDGVVHRVQIGNYLGKNYGKILTITDIKVTLKEIVTEPRGGYIERESALTMVEN
ncbi:MAG: pilus assembly protein PilP [Piscirickettsiaceae bacterium]|nr:pilus assembly protein PilP [Piscirickettsiaceae bacterium]